MNQDIHSHLELLKTELEKLEPAVKHLQKADEKATTLVTSFNNIQKEYAKHLSNIEKALVAAQDTRLEKVRKELQESLKNINLISLHISSSFTAFEKNIQNYTSNYEKLVGAASKLIEKIDKVNFPSRLETLDTYIYSINQELKSIQPKYNILHDIMSSQEAQLKKLETIEETIRQKMEFFENKTSTTMNQLSSQNRRLKVLVWISISITFLTAVIQFIKP